MQTFDASGIPAELAELRSQLEGTDRELLQLLHQRLDLATQLGEAEKGAGQPAYAPQREAEQLHARRAEAEALGLSPDLAEDILRRCMRESRLQGQGQSLSLIHI